MQRDGKASNFVVRLRLLIALVYIALDLLLISTNGAAGAAIANSASKVVSGVVAIACSVRLLNLSFPLGSVTRIGLAALAALASSAAAAWLIGDFVGSLVLAIFAAILSYPFMLRLFAGDYDLLNGLTPNLPTNIVPADQPCPCLPTLSLPTRASCVSSFLDNVPRHSSSVCDRTVRKERLCHIDESQRPGDPFSIAGVFRS